MNRIACDGVLAVFRWYGEVYQGLMDKNPRKRNYALVRYTGASVCSMVFFAVMLAVYVATSNLSLFGVGLIPLVALAPLFPFVLTGHHSAGMESDERSRYV